MRVVLDTNTVLSGIFWGGHPRQILEMARSGTISICTSQALLDELLDAAQFVALLSRSEWFIKVMFGVRRWIRAIAAKISRIRCSHSLEGINFLPQDAIAQFLSQVFRSSHVHRTA